MRQTHIKSKVLSIALAFLIAVTMTPCWAIMTTEEASADTTVANNEYSSTLYVDGDWSEGNVPAGKTWGVDAFNTIQAAVNKVNASQGLTKINVAAGTYNENVVLNKSNLKFTVNDVDWYGNVELVADDEVIMNGQFTFGNRSVNNIGNFTVSGFNFVNNMYPIYLDNNGTSSNIKITNNTIAAGDLTDEQKKSEGTIYINSSVVENVLVSGNTVTGYTKYDMDIGGAQGTVNNITVTNNKFNGKYVGIFGIVGNDGVQFTNNTFNYLWINNLRPDDSGTVARPNVGKIMLSGNSFTEMNPVLGFNPKDIVKTDIVFGEGNNYKGNSFTGWAEEKTDEELSGIDKNHGEAVYYNGKLYLGDEPDATNYVAMIGDVGYDSLNEAITAATEGQTVEIVKAGNYTPASIPKNITIKGNVDGVIFDYSSNSGKLCSIPNGCTFENIIFNFKGSNYTGFQHAGTINMNNCKLNGLLFSYSDMNFTGCTFDNKGHDYIMWLYAGDTSFEGCTFIAQNGRFFNVYNEGNAPVKEGLEEPWNVSVNNCTAINQKNEAAKAVFNVKETCGQTNLVYNVSLDGTNVAVGEFPTAKEEGALKVLNGFVQVDDRRNGGTDEGGNITIESTTDAKLAVLTAQEYNEVKDNPEQLAAKIAEEATEMNASYETPTKETAKVAKIGDVEYATLAEAVSAAQEGETIELLSNVELSSWLEFNTNNVTLNLNNKTVAIVDGGGFNFNRIAATVINGNITGTGAGANLKEVMGENNWGSLIHTYAGATAEFNNVEIDFDDLTAAQPIQNDSSTLKLIRCNLSINGFQQFAIFNNSSTIEIIDNSTIEILSKLENRGGAWAIQGNDKTTQVALQQILVKDSTFETNCTLSQRQNITLDHANVTVTGAHSSVFRDALLKLTNNSMFTINETAEHGISGAVQTDGTGNVIDLTGSSKFTVGTVEKGALIGVFFSTYADSVIKAGDTVKVSNFDQMGTDRGSIQIAGKATIEAGANVECDGKLYVTGTGEIGGGKYGELKDVSGNLTITGGYYVFDPSAYVADGYKATASDIKGYNWMVTEKAVAAIGDTEYATLQAAFDAAGDDDTVKLLRDIELSEQVFVKVNKNITFDLDGKTLTYTGNEYAVFIIEQGSTFTLQDNSTNKNGMISSGENAQTTIYVPDNMEDSSKPTVINIEGGHIKAYANSDNHCIESCGTHTKLVVSGGILETNDRCIYNTFEQVSISGGILKADLSPYLVVLDAELHVSGGEFYGGKGFFEFKERVDKAKSFVGDITGGTFIFDNDDTQFAYCYEGEDEDLYSHFVKGGKFNKQLSEDFVAEGYKCVDNTDESTMTDYPWKVCKAVASIGTGDDTKYYSSLEEAIAAVETSESTESQTIKILCDINDATGLKVDTKKTFTIDFQGHEYTVNKPGAGSTGTTTQAFQLIKGQTITFRNGIIRCNKDNLNPITPAADNKKNIKRIIQNYADFTLENMTIDGTNLCVKQAGGDFDTNKNRAVIESACGNVNIKGSTTIIDKMGAVDGDVASINVVTSKQSSYADGTHVTIGDVGTTGNDVEIGTIRCFAEYNETVTANSSISVNNGKIKNIIETDENGNTEDCVPNDVTVQLNGGIYATHLEKDVYYVDSHQAVKNTDEKTNADYPWMVGDKEDPKVIVTTKSGLLEGTALKPGTEHIATLSGGGKYVKETANVTLKAAPIDNFDFIGWYANAYGTENLVSEKLECTFKAPASDTEYIAVYEAKEAKATVTVETAGSAATSGSVSVKKVEQPEEQENVQAVVGVGSKVELTATIKEDVDPNTVFFICWTDKNSGAVVSTNSTFQTTVLKSQEVEATFLNEGAAIVNFNDDDNNLLMSGMYAASKAKEVTDVVAISKKGQVFNGWVDPADPDGDKLSNDQVKQMIQTAANAATERAKEGGSALGTVNVKAQYGTASKYKVILNIRDTAGNTVGETVTIEKNIGEAVVLRAVEREGSLQFKGFSLDASGDNYITQAMELPLNPDKTLAEGVTYTYYAVYGENQEEITRPAVITMGEPYDASTSVPKIGLTMSWALPEGAKLVQAGFLFTYHAPLTISKETLSQYQFNTTLTGDKGSFTNNLNVSGVQQYDMYFVGYVKYQINETVYLVVNGTKNSTGGTLVENGSIELSGDQMIKVNYDSQNWKYSNPSH